MSDNTKSSAGFTLPELVISISLIGIISVGLLSAMLYYFANITRNNYFSSMTVDSQNLLRSTVENLRYGAGVRQTNSNDDPNMVGGWNTSNSNFVIIIAVPATDISRNYIINPSTGSPYNNELVYYKQADTLYQRVLTDPAATGNTAQTTCPQALASPTCPADKLLTKNVDDMVFELYDQDDATTTDPLAARSVRINLSMKRDSFGAPLLLENSIRVTLRNTF